MLLVLFTLALVQTEVRSQIAGPNYLDSLKHELQVKWPNNRTINLVFHGHSVPSGYLTGGVTDRLSAYPFATLKHVNDHYPYSVVNSITTTIGGEQAEQGALRMEEVFNHNPDVIFIDYALNDRSIGLERAKIAWEQMIQEVLAHDIKLILLTPTPDLREDIRASDTNLDRHSEQIRELAKKYKVGLVDSYAFFKELAEHEDLKAFMAQNNHINQKGHQFVADLIFETYFSWKD
ncbi:MAG: lipase [Leeuwenhoekiella sp.]|nr:lipase [Leeuwenhoekiella sp.]MBA81029.1 lipase [Leeuwenhoekiella sp.]